MQQGCECGLEERICEVDSQMRAHRVESRTEKLVEVVGENTNNGSVEADRKEA
ncbi:hypothetical protein GCM10023183_20610 [Nibribacter koreensis]|uniref:Uncharacterized protein n=1 Tax=Nibribacter koreensis TaxID=1084519 RepID=A0ABP8FKG7_9BACT